MTRSLAFVGLAFVGLAFVVAGVPGRGEHVPMIKITARPNGPYLVEGDVELFDATGARVDTTGKPKIALCRCGASTTKPFCDGTHSKVGFQAAEAAVAGKP